MYGTVLDMKRGDTMRWTFNIVDATAGAIGYTQTLSGATVYFTAKKDRTDPDGSAVIVSTGQITQNGSPSTPGIVVVTLAQADTASLPAYDTVMWWELTVVDAQSKHWTPLYGPLNVMADVKTVQ